MLSRSVAFRRLGDRSHVRKIAPDGGAQFSHCLYRTVPLLLLDCAVVSALEPHFDSIGRIRGQPSCRASGRLHTRLDMPPISFCITHFSAWLRNCGGPGQHRGTEIDFGVTGITMALYSFRLHLYPIGIYSCTPTVEERR
jgi:hypothetical protein